MTNLSLECSKVSFKEFGDLLTGPAGAGDDRALIETLRGAFDPENPLRSNVLTLANTEELAAFVTIALALSSLSNQKAALTALKSTFYGVELTEAFGAHEASLPLQQFERNADGSFKLDKDKLPLPEKSPTKIARMFGSPSVALKAASGLDWAEAANLLAIASVCRNRMTHSVRLSMGNGQGGFLKSKPVAVANPYSVSEEDFLTRDTQSFSGNAAIQNRWMLALSRVEYGGQQWRLPDLVTARPDVRAQVVAHLGAAGAPGVEQFFEALTVPPDSVPLHESQVFDGSRPRSKTLSVLTAFSLQAEINRARRSLDVLFRNEQDELAVGFRQELTVLEAERDALEAEKPSFAAQKEARKAKLEVLKKAVDAKNKQIAYCEKAFLSYPSFVLPLGGSKPQNLASGLPSVNALHRANILTPIFPRKPTHLLSPKVFYASALVRPEQLDGGKTPSFLNKKSVGATAKGLRRELFAEVTYQVLGPLLQLQDLVLAGTNASDTLHQDALTQVQASSEPWALFVKGMSGSSAEMAEMLAPLVRDIQQAVKTSLVTAYSEVSDEHDNELHAVIKTIVLKEQA